MSRFAIGSVKKIPATRPGMPCGYIAMLTA
jgi:hypothetical protein